jgi:penicillin-binding protein 1A
MKRNIQLYTDGKRTYVEHTEISDFIKKAIVSAEDKTFYTNNGVDPLGIVRAIANYVRGSSDKIKGTSTLSQQLIKNTLLTNDPSLKRKVQEAYLSYQLNSEYTKDKILELYLNTISFGNNASGIEEAAKTYF